MIYLGELAVPKINTRYCDPVDREALPIIPFRAFLSGAFVKAGLQFSGSFIILIIEFF
jgi:hypothetical protein